MTPSVFAAEQPQQSPRTEDEELDMRAECLGSSETQFGEKFPRFQELLTLENQKALISPRLRECCRTNPSTRVPCYWCSAGYIHRVALSGTSLPASEFEALITRLQPRINDEDRFQNTPLHFLAASGRADVRHFALFIRAGADLRRRNIYGETFLHVLKPDMEESRLAGLLWYLLSPSCDLDLDVQDVFGSTALHRLHEHGLSEEMSFRLLQIADQSNVRRGHRDCFGRTCEMVNEDIKRVKMVIRSHLKLTGAIERPEKVTLETLCSLCENIAQKPTILAMSKAVCEQHNEPIVESIDYEGDSNRMAGFIGNLDIDLNQEDEHGNNYLQRLLRAHHRSNVEHLCSGLSELVSELIGNSQERLESLAKHVNRRGNTPLHTLVSLPSLKDDLYIVSIMRIVLDFYLRARDVHFAIERRNFDGRTILFEACANGHFYCVDTLLYHHANPNVRDFMGNSILVACEMESNRCLCLLQRPDCDELMREELTEKIANISKCVELIEKHSSTFLDEISEWCLRRPRRSKSSFFI